MRVSSSQIYNIANIGMRDAQVAVNKTNQQISSGKRVLSPADDPVAATAILMLNQELARTGQFSKNIDTADNNLTLEDTTLQSVMALVQRLKELAVSAGNTAVLTSSDYKSIAAEVDSRLGELMNLQNTRNASGQYIFAGFQSQTQPFVNNGGGNYSYRGDEGQLHIQASTTVTVAVSDSGKKIFMDIPAGHNTFNTSAVASNKASPPAVISVGEVVDQVQFDKFYPNNMLVTFNVASAVNPPLPNFTVTDRATGKILLDKQVYVPGQDIEVMGAKFAVFGSPDPGVAAIPGNIAMGTFTPTDFTAGGVGTKTLDITVGGVTETLTLDQDITSIADLVTQLGGDSAYPNTNPLSSSASASANYAKLRNLGITFDATGFHSPAGVNFTVKNGAPEIDAMTGMLTTATGTTSSDGVLAIPGDKFVIESTANQGLLTTVSRFSEAIKLGERSQAGKDALAKIVAQTLASLENVITTISAVQGEVGARQNMLESTKNMNLDIALNSQEVLSQLEDLDYAEASTRLQMQTFVLSAAQQSFIRVSELSLFKYM